jgi:hypothetical protein
MTEEEKKRYCLDDFIKWCQGQGVSLEHEEDYKPWWDCWGAAIDAAAHNIIRCIRREVDKNVKEEQEES